MPCQAALSAPFPPPPLVSLSVCEPILTPSVCALSKTQIIIVCVCKWELATGNWQDKEQQHKQRKAGAEEGRVEGTAEGRVKGAAEGVASSTPCLDMQNFKYELN